MISRHANERCVLDEIGFFIVQGHRISPNAEGYSVGRLRDHAVWRAAWDRHRDQWEGLLITFGALASGEPRLGLPNQLAPRREALRAYERVEWAKAELEGWLIEQAYEGMLRAVEDGRDSRLHTVQAKTAIAELAESVMHRICRVIGGGSFSRASPFGYWFEDVRALGFLRPPLGLSYDRLFTA